MQLDAEVFMALLRRLLPRVYQHLQQVGVGPLLYLPEWFLCLFTRSLPFPTVLRIWDAFLSEGEWGFGGLAHFSEFAGPFWSLALHGSKCVHLIDSVPE